VYLKCKNKPKLCSKNVYITYHQDNIRPTLIIDIGNGYIGNYYAKSELKLLFNAIRCLGGVGGGIMKT
jgi:hypothetical protein